MVKFFWQLVYKFKKPVTKTDIVLWYCRVNGIQYSHLKNTKIAFKDFKTTQSMEKEV